jgi:hypothetical protein
MSDILNYSSKYTWKLIHEVTQSGKIYDTPEKVSELLSRVADMAAQLVYCDEEIKRLKKKLTKR